MLNIDFLEEYKRLDHLCKDILSSNDGISEYIRQMEEPQYSDCRFVNTWDDDYRQLKHMRWVRNKLTHEIGTLNSDICREDDIEWVKSFYNRIINTDDPLSAIRKSKEERAKQEKQKAAPNIQKNSPVQTLSAFWNKLVTNIKDFFS